MRRAILATRVDDHRHVHDGVDAQPTHELADHGLAGVGVHEVHVLVRGDRVIDVAAEQPGHLRREAARDLGAEWVGYARDEDAGRKRWGHPPIMGRFPSRS